MICSYKVTAKLSNVSTSEVQVNLVFNGDSPIQIIEFFNSIGPEPTFSRITVKVKNRHGHTEEGEEAYGGRLEILLFAQTQSNFAVKCLKNRGAWTMRIADG